MRWLLALLEEQRLIDPYGDAYQGHRRRVTERILPSLRRAGGPTPDPLDLKPSGGSRRIRRSTPDG